VLVVGGLFLWKRHRRPRGEAQLAMAKNEYAVESAGSPTYEMPQSGAVKYEAYGTPHAELHHESRPVELPGEIPGRGRRSGV
jgi:hypothetical protein